MRTPYQEMYDEVHAPGSLREAVRNLTKLEQKSRKRVGWLLAAAALVAVLMSVAGADSDGLREPLREDLPVIGPVTLEEELGRKWVESGGVLDEEQKAVIAQAVQDVHVSDTQDGVTVTIDSVYATEFYLELLLNIQGEDLAGSNLSAYELYGSVLSAPDREITHNYIGASYLGVMEDGTVVESLELGISQKEGLSLLDGAELELRLGNLKTYGEEKWVLPISLAPAVDREALTLEEAVTETATLREIWVTARSFRFRADAESSSEIYLCLSNGREVKHGVMSSSGKRDGHWEVEGCWPAPADFSQIVALRVGDTVIPLRP